MDLRDHSVTAASGIPGTFVKGQRVCPICSQIMSPRDSTTIHVAVAHPGVLEFARLPVPLPAVDFDDDYCDDEYCDCRLEEYDDDYCTCDDPEGHVRRDELLDAETFEDTFEGIASECLDLLVKKQVSYGPKNIESLGFFGVFDRLSSDKVERLRNAMQGTVENGKVRITFSETLADESIEDTLKDMVNYALILIALKRGLWGRPLRGEK